MKSLSLYIHIPFCSRSCPYCTFYHIGKSPDLERPFAHRAVEEIGAEFDKLARRHSAGQSPGASPPIHLKTIYFGGGTPSILSGSVLRALTRPLASFLHGDATEERSIELNPEDITGEGLDALAHMGFDRVSVGIQSMSLRAQRVLGRSEPRVNHAALEAVQSRFGNFNADLLLGIPGGTEAEVLNSAEALFPYEPKHFSVYCLEAGGESPERVRRFISRVDQEQAAAEYLSLCGLLESRGYIHYEVSNFALPGYESKHNLAYWEGGDYLGIGPAAHSFVDGVRWFNASSLDSYLAVRGGDFADVRTVETPGRHERYLERLFLGLRTNRGVPVDTIGASPAEIDALTASGLARIVEERLVLSDRGFLLLDEIILRLAGSDD